MVAGVVKKNDMTTSKLCLIFNLAIYIFLLFSCKETSNTDKTILKETVITLSNSTNSINNSSTMILASLKERSMDPFSKERAEIWLKKAESIVNLSAALIGKIQKVKNGNHIKAEQSDLLYKDVLNYKKDDLSVDSSIRLEFDKTISLVTNQFEIINNGNEKFYTKFFKNASTIGTSCMLTNILNSVRVIENKLLAFCNSRTTYHKIHDYFPALLIGQNSSTINQGELLEISAGIGRFSNEVKLVGYIDGKKINVSDEGYFIYKKNVSQIPGKYKIPVKISYLNRESGKDETQEINVEYTVIKTCDQ